MKHEQKLDELLRDWAAKTQPDEAERENLRAKVCQRLREIRVPRSRKMSTPLRGSQACPQRARWAAACAVLLLLAGLTLPQLFRHTPEITAEKAIPETPESLVLFEEVSRLFGDQLRWAVETESGLHLNIDEDHARGTSDCGTPLVVETVVLSEDDAAGTWHRLWKARTLTCAEYLVQSPVNGQEQGQLLLWALRLPNGHVVVETALSLSDSELSDSFGDVLAPGETKNVATIRREGRVYRVQQRVRAFQPQEKV